jgi:uncharacterized protein YgiM (DUF1202 family)
MNRNHLVLAGGAIALLVGFAAALTGSTNTSSSAMTVQSSAMLPSVSPPSQPASAPALITPVPSPPPALSQPVAPTIAIAACNGISASANFRSAPTIDSSVVLQSLPPGSVVALTGNVANNGGLRWYQVQSGGQFGWIAACFVD